MRFAAPLVVAVGCGGGSGSGVAAEDLAGKSDDVQTNIIVETVCETTCPSYGIYCLAPDPAARAVDVARR